MAKDLTDLWQRAAGAQHRRRGRVPEPVRMHGAQPGALRGVEHDLADTARGQRPVRGMNPDEHAAPDGCVGSASSQVSDDRRAHIGRQRQPLSSVAFAYTAISPCRQSTSPSPSRATSPARNPNRDSSSNTA